VAGAASCEVTAGKREHVSGGRFPLKGESARPASVSLYNFGRVGNEK
jgi:hypothetical protein